MGLQSLEWEDVDWINLAQDTEKLHNLMKMVMKLWIKKCGQFDE
jgi:hypothetical protein